MQRTPINEQLYYNNILIAVVVGAKFFTTTRYNGELEIALYKTLDAQYLSHLRTLVHKFRDCNAISNRTENFFILKLDRLASVVKVPRSIGISCTSVHKLRRICGALKHVVN